MGRKIDLIQESPYVPSRGQITVLEEGYEETGDARIKFRAILQTSGVKNVNGRVYPPEVLQSIVDQLKPKAKIGALLSELDHPLTPSSDPAVLKRRASVVSLDHACAQILDLDFDGEKIVGTLQTLTTPKGQTLRALIKDGVAVGFSARLMGTTTAQPDGSLVVQMPVKAFTFDCVANPSHVEAKIIEIFNESANVGDVIKEFELISEDVTVTDNMQQVLTEFVERGGAIGQLLEENEADEKQICFNGVCTRGTVDEIVEFIVENALYEEKLNKLQLKV